MATLTVYADTADGYIESADIGDGESDGTYANARAGTGSNLAVAGGLMVGQLAADIGTGDGTYRCYEAFVSFDTSSLTADATVSAAVLSLYPLTDQSVTNFTIQARAKDWGASLTTADWVAGASLGALTLLATHDVTTWSGAAYKDFTDVALPANVSTTGTTSILLNSSRHAGNNTPTGNEYVNSYQADTAGTTQDPKIVVTYSVPVVAAGAKAHALRALWGNNGWR